MEKQWVLLQGTIVLFIKRSPSGSVTFSRCSWVLVLKIFLDFSFFCSVIVRPCVSTNCIKYAAEWQVFFSECNVGLQP